MYFFCTPSSKYSHSSHKFTHDASLRQSISWTTTDDWRVEQTLQTFISKSMDEWTKRLKAIVENKGKHDEYLFKYTIVQCCYFSIEVVYITCNLSAFRPPWFYELNIHEHVTCHNVACHWMINTASTDADGRRRASTSVDVRGRTPVDGCRRARCEWAFTFVTKCCGCTRPYSCQVPCTNLYVLSRQYCQGRLIQRARRARAQGPQASGGPQTENALFFHLVE